MSKKTPYRKGKVLEKAPLPPTGFVAVKPKTKQDKDSGCSQMVCPYCDNTGWSAGCGTYYTDKDAQEFYESLEKNFPDLCGYEQFCQEFEGVMIKCHWSRMASYTCSNCGGILYHDWDCGYDKDGKYHDMNYYMKTPDTQLTQFESKQIEKSVSHSKQTIQKHTLSSWAQKKQSRTKS
jgi:hypothetical protein